MKSCTESVEPSSAAAVLLGSKVGSVGAVQCVDTSVCELAGSSEEVVPISKDELKREQETDEVIGPVRNFVLSGCKPKRADWNKLSALSKVLMRSFTKLKMTDDGLLVRETA